MRERKSGQTAGLPPLHSLAVSSTRSAVVVVFYQPLLGTGLSPPALTVVGWRPSLHRLCCSSQWLMWSALHPECHVMCRYTGREGGREGGRERGREGGRGGGEEEMAVASMWIFPHFLSIIKLPLVDVQ